MLTTSSSTLARTMVLSSKLLYTGYFFPNAIVLSSVLTKVPRIDEYAALVGFNLIVKGQALAR